MTTIKRIIFLAFSIFALSCSPSKPAASSGKYSGKSGTALDGGATGTENETATTSSKKSTSTTSRVAPNFQTADTNFGKTGSKLLIKPVEDANKVFLVQRIRSYRPIWLDLKKQLADQSAFWSFMTKTSTAMDSSFVGGFTREVFEIDKGEPTAEVSVHQTIPSFAGSDDLATKAERGDSYKIIGHTVTKSLTLPTLPTAVLSLYAIPPSDPLSAAIMPPMSYQTVYTRLGPLTADIMQGCMEVQKAGMDGRFPHADDKAKCDSVTAGAYNIYDFMHVQMGGSTMTGVGDLNNYYTMQTLVVWQPIPNPGYQCLGHIVTNTADQPATSADAGGMAAQNIKTLIPDQTGKLTEQYDWDYPVYCVAEKYLVPGMLVPVATNGSVDFYAIGPDPKYPKGLAKMNLFYAVPSTMTNEERGKIKVWVLNTDFVKVLPDLNFKN